MVKVINEVKAAMNDTGRSLAAIQTYHHENNIEMVSSELMTARQQLNVNLHQVINDLTDIKIKLSQDYKKQKQINKRKQSLENAKIVSPSALSICDNSISTIGSNDGEYFTVACVGSRFNVASTET